MDPQQTTKELKVYSESLEQRSLEMACELEKERNKNKQLMSALSFMMASEEEKGRRLEERLSQMNENGSRLEVEQNRREMVEAEVKALRLENGYLKDLVLIANGNYEQLEEKNRLLL